MRSNKFGSLKRKAYIPVILALTCFILVVVGGYYLVKIKSSNISTLKFTNVFSQVVILQLQKLVYEHDDKIFDPVEYSLINNTLKPIYFLRGCAVSLPKIYKVENNKRTELQEIHVCTAEPEIVQLSSGSKIYLMWDQKIRGKFVKDGKYQFGLEYKLEKNGEEHEVFSDIFSIKEVRWDLNKQKQICDLFKSGVRSNSSVYSKQDCLNKL